jgi:hypothetical protein
LPPAATEPAPAQARSVPQAAEAFTDIDRWQVDDGAAAELAVPPVRALLTALCAVLVVLP